MGMPLTNEQESTIIDLLEACSEKPDRAFWYILEILELNPNEAIIGYLGAGPLEDLLLKHGDKFIDKIIKEAANNTLLFKCLSYVDLDTEDFARADEIYSFLETNKSRTAIED